MVDICNRDKDLINYLYDAINYNHIKIYCKSHQLQFKAYV